MCLLAYHHKEGRHRQYISVSLTIHPHVQIFQSIQLGSSIKSEARPRMSVKFHPNSFEDIRESHDSSEKIQPRRQFPQNVSVSKHSPIETGTTEKQTHHPETAPTVNADTLQDLSAALDTFEKKEEELENDVCWMGARLRPRKNLRIYFEKWTELERTRRL